MWKGELCNRINQTVKTSVFPFYFITVLNHCLCHCAEPTHVLYYSHSQTAEEYPCVWHCRGNEKTLRHLLWSLVMSGRQNEEAYYSIPGLSVDIWSQMCSQAIAAGVISVALIPHVPTPHDRQPASASLNCSELISPGHCSTFRHLLSEGGDYGST